MIRASYAIIVQHGDGPLYSTYGHNDAALVEMGDIVAAGETIAEVGNEGYSFGAHLHFEILEGAPFTGDWQVPFANACGAYRDPKSYVAP
jgi:murein DD-endopeptidase MepM/ murein hydrolase activator NlpD